MVAATLAVTAGAVAVSYAALADPPVETGEVLYPREVVRKAATEPTTAKTKRVAKASIKRTTPTVKSEDATGFATLAEPSTPPPAEPKKAEQPEPTKPELSLIKIPAGAGALYDPSARGTSLADDPSDPAAVYDADDESSWAVTSSGEGDLLVGYVVDLGRDRSLQQLELLTDTPGFRAEIFGAAVDELPTQVTDPSWTALKSRDNVDGTSKEEGKAGDGTERITIGDGSEKYRYVLIWFTKPAPVVAPDPPSRTVRLFDLKLYG